MNHNSQYMLDVTFKLPWLSKFSIILQLLRLSFAFEGDSKEVKAHRVIQINRESYWRTEISGFKVATCCTKSFEGWYLVLALLIVFLYNDFRLFNSTPVTERPGRSWATPTWRTSSQSRRTRGPSNKRCQHTSKPSVFKLYYLN
jgi:hypothetical protein